LSLCAVVVGSRRIGAANGALAKLGVLPLRPDALDRLARVSDVVFDKTGTLSDGKPWLVEADTFGGMDRVRALRIARRPGARQRTPARAGVFRRAGRSGVGPATSSPSPAMASKARSEPTAGASAMRRTPAGGKDDGALWLGDGRQHSHAS
jgi:Cu2+-exporting ATPase